MSNDRSPTELASDFAAVARVALGAGSQATALTTLLHIGDEHVVVLSGHGDKPETVHRLDLGASRIARAFFHHDPPMSHEIERAIDRVEDEVMQLRRAADANAMLVSTDPGLRAWGAVTGPNMPIETVEQWFQRLASASLGHPGALHGVPAGREAAATLLVLREFMHHLGYASIVAVELDRR
jgi:exopolyphosphatase/pppGpp-phosphohydrolase